MKKSQGPVGHFKLSDQSETIHIYGAGVCGLLFGHYLKKNGFKIKIYEKQDRVGGKIQTIIGKNGICETAANAIYTNQDIIELLKELKLDYILPQPKLKKFVFRNGPKSFPLSFFELFKAILNLRKEYPKDINTSVYDFFKPLLGEKASKEVIGSAFNGIYASPIEELSFYSIFKQDFKSKTYFGFFKELKNTRKGFKSTSISFLGGMNTFINALRKQLDEEIVLNSTKELVPFENNIICTDAASASELLKNDFSKLSHILSSIPYSPINTTTVFTRKKINFLDKSFGVLFPYNLNKALGIIHNSAIFKQRSKENYQSYTFISKNVNNDFTEDYVNSDEKITTKWEDGLPIYNQQRQKAIGELRSLFFEIPNNLLIFGNYVDGISIREMTSHIKKFSQEVRG